MKKQEKDICGYKAHNAYPDFLKWLNRGPDSDYGERDDTEENFQVFLIEIYDGQSNDVCPQCGHNNIEGDLIEIEGCEAWQKCSCPECKAEWNEIYEFKRHEILKEGEK